MPSGSGHLYASFTSHTPNPAVHDLHVHVDSSDEDGGYLEIHFPEGLVGVNETEVFLSLYGDGIGEENVYRIMYENGLNRSTCLKMFSVSLLLAYALSVFLQER